MDISALLTGQQSSLPIDMTVEISNVKEQTTDMLALSPVHVVGVLRTFGNQELILQVTVEGTMTLADSISLAPVLYPFHCEIDQDVQENVKKDENTLDFLPILWENIVLEVPIRFSKEDDYSSFSGEGWKLVSEEEYQKPKEDNPFKELLEELEKE